MTEKEFLVRVRNIVTEKSSGKVDINIPTIKSMINPALDLWARNNQDFNVRNVLRNIFSATLDVSGEVSLSNYLNGTSGKIILEDIVKSPVYAKHLGNKILLNFVADEMQLDNSRITAAGTSSNVYGKYYLSNNNFIKTSGNGTRTFFSFDIIEFSAVNIPQNFSSLPQNLHENFLTYIVQFLMQQKSFNL